MSEDWRALVARADLMRAHDEIAELVRHADREAASEGAAAYWRDDAQRAISAFLQVPSPDLAVHLLEVAPQLARYFEPETR